MLMKNGSTMFKGKENRFVLIFAMFLFAALFFFVGRQTASKRAKVEVVLQTVEKHDTLLVPFYKYVFLDRPIRIVDTVVVTDTVVIMEQNFEMVRPKLNIPKNKKKRSKRERGKLSQTVETPNGSAKYTGTYDFARKSLRTDLRFNVGRDIDVGGYYKHGFKNNRDVFGITFNCNF